MVNTFHEIIKYYSDTDTVAEEMSNTDNKNRCLQAMQDGDNRIFRLSGRWLIAV